MSQGRKITGEFARDIRRVPVSEDEIQALIDEARQRAEGDLQEVLDTYEAFAKELCCPKCREVLDRDEFRDDVGRTNELCNGCRPKRKPYRDPDTDLNFWTHPNHP